MSNGKSADLPKEMRKMSVRSLFPEPPDKSVRSIMPHAAFNTISF